MNRFEITIFGIRLAARGYVGILGAIIVTIIVLAYALALAHGERLMSSPGDAHEAGEERFATARP